MKKISITSTFFKIVVAQALLIVVGSFIAVGRMLWIYGLHSPKYLLDFAVIVLPILSFLAALLAIYKELYGASLSSTSQIQHWARFICRTSAVLLMLAGWAMAYLQAILFQMIYPHFLTIKFSKFVPENLLQKADFLFVEQILSGASFILIIVSIIIHIVIPFASWTLWNYSWKSKTVPG